MSDFFNAVGLLSRLTIIQSKPLASLEANRGSVSPLKPLISLEPMCELVFCQVTSGDLDNHIFVTT